jgi:tripartite-type tricarboxylate transporter receptor subunit TctC
MNRVARLAVALLLALGSVAAGAQTYPARPVQLVVGFPPGGGVDIVARQLAERLSQQLGQPVVVDNKPGAAGNIAMELVSRAKPDGYTLMMGNLGMLCANPVLYPKLGFDTTRDFAPVARVVVTPLIAAVPASLPAASLAEFVALAKGKPGQMNYGSGGTGNVNHLAVELFQMQSGTKLQHVPYKGSAPALTDLIAGRIELVIDGANVVQPFVAAGTARALAITGESRLPSMPALPTAREAGMADFVVYGWQGVFAPAGTPPAIIEQLNAEIGKALADPTLRSKLSGQGTEPSFTSAAQFRDYIAAEQKRWGDVIRTAKIVLE